MSIIRAPRKESNFYVLDKKISEDKRLSWAARGLLVFLLGKPDHWTVNVQALINETKGSRKSTGRDGVWGLLKELIDVGYCTRSQLRKADGTLGEMAYTISEQCTEPRTDFQGAEPHTGLPGTAQPFTANPPLVSTDVLARTQLEQGLIVSQAQAPAPASTPAPAPALPAAPAQAPATTPAPQPPAPPAPAQEPQVPKDKAARKTSYPADFEPNDTAVRMANELCVDINSAQAAFADHHCAKGSTMADWQAAFRNWLRNAEKFAKQDAAKLHGPLETTYQRTMREKVEKFAPSVAKRAPQAPQPPRQSAADFFMTIDVPATVKAATGALE